MRRDEPLSSYEDEVVEKRKRTIHVFEEMTAHISGWHGGVHVTDFTAFTHKPTAIDEAQKICDRLGITNSSSLHIRVDVEKRRVFKTLSTSRDRYDPYEADRPRADEVIMRRHVWDSHEGELGAQYAVADVEMVMPFGMKIQDDPGDQVTQILHGAQARFGARWQLLYDGLGIGEIKNVSVERSECDVPPGDNDGFKRSMERWANLIYRGRLSLEIPYKMKAAEVTEHLADIEVSPLLDRHFLGGIVRRFCVYSGEPRLRFKIMYPGAIDADAVRPALEFQK